MKNYLNPLAIIKLIKRKMETAKLIGYILSVAGLGIIALSGMISKLLGFLGAKAMTYTVVGGVVLVVAGLALILTEGSSDKVKQSEEEVPIYEGEGKKRKIVGYQRASK